MVRPAGRSCGSECRRELATVSQVKRNCTRVIACGRQRESPKVHEFDVANGVATPGTAIHRSRAPPATDETALLGRARFRLPLRFFASIYFINFLPQLLSNAYTSVKGQPMHFLILIITADASAADDLREGLAEAKDGPFQTECAVTLGDALARTSGTGVDCILLDLDLPDSAGIATFDTLFNAVPGIPIVVLSCKGGDSDAIEAVQHGAQGYFSQGYFRIILVPQALRSIIERKAIEEALYVEQQRSRAILEAIDEAVLVMDLNGRISYLNPSAERLTGWANEQACGRPLPDIATILDRDSRESAWSGTQNEIHKNKRTPSMVGLVFVGRDAHETVIEMSVAPVHERNGRLSGAVIVLHDATQAEASHNSKNDASGQS